MRWQVKYIFLVLTTCLAMLGVLASLLLWIPGVAADEPAAQGLRLAGGVWVWGLLAAALATGVSTVAAAYAVAKIGTAAMGALAEKPELFGRLLVVVGLAEGIAIYGLIISILILNRLA